MSYQLSPLTMNCATALVRGRFVTVTEATQTVAYTTAAAAADAITVEDATAKGSAYIIPVIMLNRASDSFIFESGDTIAKGGDVEVGTDGVGVPENGGEVVCVSREASVDGQFTEGYVHS